MLGRLVRAMMVLLLGQAASRIAGLLIIPLYLGRWSAEGYGEWLALNAIVGYLAMVDLGMYPATTTALTQCHARNDLKEYVRVQNSGLVFSLAVAVMGCGLLGLAAYGFPLKEWLALRLIPDSEVRIVLILLGVHVLWSLPVRYLGGIYQSVGDLARLHGIYTVQQLATVSACFVALSWGRGRVTIALIQILVLMMWGGYLVWDLNRRHSLIAPGLFRADMAVIRQLLRPGLSYSALGLSQLITHQGTVVLVSRAFGGSAVALLSTTRTLCAFIRTITENILVAILPEITRLRTQESAGHARCLHRITIACAGTLAVAWCATIWWEGAEFIQVWTRGRLVPDVWLMRLLLLWGIAQQIWTSSSSVSVSANEPGVMTISASSSACLAIVVIGLSIPYLALMAVPTGLLAGDLLICSHFIIRHSCRLLGEPYGAFASRVWSATLLAAIVAGFMAWSGHSWLPAILWVRGPVVGLISITVSGLLFYAILLGPFDRQLIAERLHDYLVLRRG